MRLLRRLGPVPLVVGTVQVGSASLGATLEPLFNATGPAPHPHRQDLDFG